MNRRAWWSVGGLAAIAVSLSAGACGSGSHATASKSTDGGASADATTASCATDSDCAASMPPTIPAGCATGKCNALQGTCDYVAKDQDGDGHPAANCVSTNGIAIQVGDDCNDQDPNLYPGHPESCNTLIDGGAAGPGFCQSGSISCEPNGMQTGCVGTLVCPSNESCVSETCGGTCGPSQTQCAPQVNGVEACTGGGTWGNPVPCVNQTCLSGSCQGVCAPTQAQCSGNAVETCDTSTGMWGSPVACMIGEVCTDGQCLACVPGTTECSGNSLVTCATNGSWGIPTSCAPGQCVQSSSDAGVTSAACEGSCVTGTKQCAATGNAVQTCGPSGSWGATAVPCSASLTCVSGVCTGQCGPTQTECISNGVATCQSNGTWSNPAGCVHKTCVTGSGCEGACAPGDTGCNGTTPWTCGATGNQAAGAITPGTCGAQCAPGTHQCNSVNTFVYQTCQSDGTWNAGSVVGGQCNAACTPGSQQCNTTYTQVCTSSGQWPTPGTAVQGQCGAECTPATTPYACGPVDPDYGYSDSYVGCTAAGQLFQTSCPEECDPNQCCDNVGNCGPCTGCWFCRCMDNTNLCDGNEGCL
jgi:hypothetical protein